SGSGDVPRRPMGPVVAFCATKRAGVLVSALAYRLKTSPPGRSLMITFRHTPLPSAVGKTQTSRVMPVVRSRAPASGTLTQLLAPLKDTALLKRPAPVQAAFASDALRLLPEPSAAMSPVPSSNE